MFALHVVPPSQMEAAIRATLGLTAVNNLVVTLHYVSDFMGTWYKISRDRKGADPNDGVASPEITRKLKAMGVIVGDQVLVAHCPLLPFESRIRVISPIGHENYPFVGQAFEVHTENQLPLMLA